MLDAYPKATGGRIGYFEDWLTHPDAADPYWTSPDAAAGAPAPAVPVSLLTGWQDICLDQNLAEYQRLRAAGPHPAAGHRPVVAYLGLQRRPADRGRRGAGLADRVLQ